MLNTDIKRFKFYFIQISIRRSIQGTQLNGSISKAWHQIAESKTSVPNQQNVLETKILKEISVK